MVSTEFILSKKRPGLGRSEHDSEHSDSITGENFLHQVQDF